MRWKDAPDLPLFASGYPCIADLLERGTGGAVRFWFVLEADDWDTLLGDAVLQYFQGAVFDSGPAAEARMGALNAEAERNRRETGEPGVRCVLRSFELRKEGPVLVPSGHEPKAGQDYYIEKIVARVEETLASGGGLSWGTRYPGW